ncbi:hypothetical protein AEQU_0662 [Adlercreutzia equolifaciens DSM 19450]|nr:hypothetical protein AEQU_0662 [Adlercreutzia equolifaciens DSM 19450]
MLTTTPVTTCLAPLPKIAVFSSFKEKPFLSMMDTAVRSEDIPRLGILSCNSVDRPLAARRECKIVYIPRISELPVTRERLERAIHLVADHVAEYG